MINLLPPQQKEELKEEESFKLILITGILLSIFLIYFCLILFSIKIYISGEVKSQEILFSQREKEVNTPQAQTLQKNLIDFNQTLSRLYNFYKNQIIFSNILEKISETLPEGVSLTSISISPAPAAGDWRMDCNLTGFSLTREALLLLKENLEKEETFGKISFPPANWAKPADISFTVSLKTK